MAVYHVETTTLSTDEHFAMTILHHVHNGTAAQTLGSVSLALMLVKPHVVGITLHLGHQQSIGGCRQ